MVESHEVQGCDSISFIFDEGHILGYGNYKDLIWVIYPDLDLGHLPPFNMDMVKFIMEIYASALNPY